MELKEYFQRLKDKKVLVLGLGVSNQPLVELLLDYGIDVTGCDRTPYEKLEQPVLDLERRGLKLHLGEDYLDGISGDVAFRTPGLHPLKPQLEALRQAGTKITSEMEAFFEVCPCKIIAVTGSDGKTTTTTLISEILRHAGHKVWLGGNIGTPLLNRADEMQPEDRVVLELSSFQLMDLGYSSRIALVTNLAPNHLDVHKDMQEYIDAKKNIFLRQEEEDVLILNRDNAITAAFASEGKGSIRWFSRLEELSEGVCLKGDTIYEDGIPVMTRQDILLPGIHNVENYMAAIAAVKGLATHEDIRYVAQHFGGVEHRIELVRIKDGVKFYNDSIASSPSRTMAGLRSFDKKLILIAGGYDKHVPFDELGEEIAQRVKLLICTGDTGPKIKAAVLNAHSYAEGCPRILDVEDFYEAVRTAAREAESGDAVILSPAGPAFDRFKNFMVRGAEFKKTVQEL